jgi:hypothetical protein
VERRYAPLDVLRAVWNALANGDADLAGREAVDCPIDSEATPGRQLDRQQAEIASERQAGQYGIVGRRCHQRRADVHLATIHALHETGLTAPHRRPQLALVSGGG